MGRRRQTRGGTKRDGRCLARRLRFATAQVGGNAVLAMRFDTGEIADIMNEVAAYGTAVTVESVD